MSFFYKLFKIKFREGWFVKARKKWLCERIWKWTYYANEHVSCCTPWVEDFNENRQFSRGLCPNTDEEQMASMVAEEGFWKAWLFHVRGKGKLYYYKRVKSEDYEPRASNQ